MNEQLELFPIELDDRIERLREFFRSQISWHPLWCPTAKQIVELSYRYGTLGSKPLEAYKQVVKEMS